jgi:lipoprotein-releasing system permease protein
LFKGLSLFVGFKWLFSSKNRNPFTLKGLVSGSVWMSVLSLGLSLAFLLLTLAIVSGFENTLATAISNSQGHVLHQISKWKNFEELENWVTTMPHANTLERVEFFWTSQGLLVGEKAGRGILIEGRTRSLGSKTNSRSEVPESPDVITIELGQALAEILGVSKGSSLQVLLPGVIEGAVTVKVSGLVKIGMYDVESRYAVIDSGALSRYVAQKFPDLYRDRPGDAHGVRYFLNSDYKGTAGLKGLKNWVQDYEAFMKAVEPDFDRGRIQTWQDQKLNLFKGIGHNKIELGLILALLVLVASLNIGATFVVLFLERDREFAIMRAIGWSAGAMQKWMLGVSLGLGILVSTGAVVLAPIIGLGLQSLKWAQLPEEIYNIKYLPLTFGMNELIMVWLYGVVCTVLVSLFLGWKLSRISLLGVLNHRRM